MDISNVKKLEQLYVGNAMFVYYDICVIDPDSKRINFLSLIDKEKYIDDTKKQLKHNNNIFLRSDRRYYSYDFANMDFIKKRQAKSDFAHLVAYVKDNVDNININGVDDQRIICYLYLKKGDFLNEKLYDKIYKYTSVPIIPEWMDYLKTKLINKKFLNPLEVKSIYEDTPFTALKLEVTKNALIDIIQTGLRNKEITINGCTENSNLMELTDGLDSYLNIFADTLAERIQNSFHPKFIPGQDEYSEYVNNYDDSCFYNGLELYNAQKAGIQSCVNNLNVNRTALVIAEMGSGKTAIGAGIAYAHYQKKSGMTAVVMCPGHLVDKWKREVERLVPNGKAYIIKSVKELIALKDKILDKNKPEHSFLILSKDTAKFSYEKRPSAIWSESKQAFICPECGQILQKKVFVGQGRAKHAEMVNLDPLDFRKPWVFNQICKNKIRVYDKKEKKLKEVECGCKLWVPLNKNDKTIKWTKLGSDGWINKHNINNLIVNLEALNNIHQLKTAERNLLGKLVDFQNIMGTEEEYKGLKAPRKYSIAKYIREKFKNKIDYFICDELDLMAPHTVMCAQNPFNCGEEKMAA